MERADLILTHGLVITIDGAFSQYPDGAVAISGDRIVAVGASADILSRYAAAETVDCAGCVIMPGLINCHTHVPMTLLRGLADDLRLDVWLYGYMLPAEQKFVSPEFVRLGAQLAAAEMIRSGVTCVNDMYYFEDAVADGHAVVVEPDGGVGGGEQSVTHPDLGRGHARAGPDASRRRLRAFSSVSAHSPSGVESQVMPPPVPKFSSSSSIQNVRIATLRSPTRRSASTQPMAPQYTPRGSVSRSSITPHAAILGAPVTEPGGNVASMASDQPRSGCRRPVTVDTRWKSPGCAT